MIKVQILDYGIGNIKSLFSALSYLNFKPIVDNKLKKNIDLLILPGVGSFGNAMNLLKCQNLIDEIKNYSLKGSKLLGICLGMQILFNNSEESEHIDGLKLINGNVKKLPILSERTKLPNINWSELRINQEHSFFNSDENFKGSHYYFLHSYYCSCEDNLNISAYSKFNNFDFCAIVNKENIFGLQFHPEKSRKQGLELLKKIIFY